MKKDTFTKQVEFEMDVRRALENVRSPYRVVTRGDLAKVVLGTIGVSLVAFALCVTTGEPGPVLGVMGTVIAIAGFAWGMGTIFD